MDLQKKKPTTEGLLKCPICNKHNTQAGISVKGFYRFCDRCGFKGYPSDVKREQYKGWNPAVRDYLEKKEKEEYTNGK